MTCGKGLQKQMRCTIHQELLVASLSHFFENRRESSSRPDREASICLLQYASAFLALPGPCPNPTPQKTMIPLFCKATSHKSICFAKTISAWDILKSVKTNHAFTKAMATMFRITHISYMWNDSKICHTVTLEKKNAVLAISHNLKLNLPESLWYNGSFAFSASPCDTPRDIGKCWHPQSALHKGDLILGWNQHTSAPYLADIQWTATKLNLSAMFKKTPCVPVYYLLCFHFFSKERKQRILQA